MSTVAICLAKNEADIIADTVGWMLTQVDHVIVADNLSTDNTGDIAADLGAEVILDPNPAHAQSAKITELALEAQAEGGYEWLVPFDADEIWFAAGGVRIGDALNIEAMHAMTAEAKIMVHPAVPGAAVVPEGPVGLMTWRRVETLPLRKVAGRIREGMIVFDGNHRIFYPDIPFPLTVTDLLEVRHFPYRSAEQMIRKVRQGAMALRLAYTDKAVGGHWHQLDELTDEQIEQVFIDHHYCPRPSERAASGLVHDPAPRAR